MVIFAEVPVFIFTKIRGGGEEINCTLHINMLHTKKTRRFAPRRKGFHWTPEGHCGCLVKN